MLNARSIQGIIVLIIGIFLAIWLGLSIVTNQAETIIKVIGAVVFIGCLFLGRRIWLLIPFGAALGIGLRLPGQPDALLLAQILVLGFSTLLFLMRKLPFQLRWTELELWVVVLTLFIVQVYARNPVGVNIFGGETVGGKAYAIYAISLVSALLLAGLRVPAKELKWVLRLTILGGLANAAISIAGHFFPAISYYTGQSFTRSDEVNYENYGQAVDAGSASRISVLTEFGNNASLWVSSFISPLRACLHPLWGALLFLAVVASVMGGFRNGIAAVGLTLVIGIACRSGASGLLVSSLGGAGGIALLAAINLIQPLPPNVQRTLTVFPGTWEERYKIDGESSSEWRYEIWREVLLTDRWIHNKWIGDGLGFSAAELAAQLNNRTGTQKGISGFDAQRESILASGDYHSGPVSTIRVIGYIGLLAFLLAQIRLAVHAHRQIIRCRNTEWLPLALIIGIPMIVAPPFFAFVFGDFRAGAAGFLLSYGMMRLLENNLPLPAYAKPSRVPYMLPSGNHARVKEQG